MCPPTVMWHRLRMVGDNSPSALKYNPITVTTDYGNSSRPWGKMLKVR